MWKQCWWMKCNLTSDPDVSRSPENLMSINEHWYWGNSGEHTGLSRDFVTLHIDILELAAGFIHWQSGGGFFSVHLHKPAALSRWIVKRHSCSAAIRVFKTEQIKARRKKTPSICTPRNHSPFPERHVASVTTVCVGNSWSNSNELSRLSG